MAFERNVIFVSYAHAERSWWQDRLRIFVLPWAEEHGLELWADVYDIPVGDDWQREIKRALARARMGVLMVSQAFLVSPFIQDEEVPPLLAGAKARELCVCCVPVSSFTRGTERAKRLETFQWTRSPDLPLDLLETEGLRNQALVEIAARIRDVMPTVARTTVTLRPPVAVPERVTVETVAPLGPLYVVPSHKPHYQPRPTEVARLRQHLVAEGVSSVGITAAPYAVGLRGQGGIGKTELAIEAVHDDEVRRAFPDGILWLTLGQTPDLLALQRELLTQAGADATSVTTMSQCRTALGECFATRRSLVVLDDVWDTSHARVFATLGPQSRQLVTTRDGGVLTALGAREVALEVLPAEQALQVLADWSGTRVEALPPVASKIAEECGHLPLALSLAGALVRDGTPWEDVHAALAAGRLTFLDHPYGSIFATLKTSVDALSPDEKARYLELAVFPEDVHVPVTTIARLWARTGGLDAPAARRLLARLVQRGLLYQDETSAVFFHDLQQDYVRLCIDDLANVHAALVDAHRVGNVAAGPASLLFQKDEPYLWDWLGHHLIQTGRPDELRECLLSYPWLQAKLDARGVQPLRRDFALLPRDEAVARVGAAVRQGAHILAHDAKQLPAQLLGRLARGQLPDVDHLLEEARLPGFACLVPRASSLTRSGSALLETFAHNSSVMSVAVTPDGARVISGYGDAMRVWDLATSTEVFQLNGHTDLVSSVAVSPDGTRLISGGDDNTVRVWDLATGTEMTQLNGHTASVRSVAVTPDGTRVISGGDDNVVRVWDLASGTEVAQLTGHTAPVQSVAVTPDGTRVISGGDDNVVRVWDLASGTEVAQLTGHAASVLSVAVTPDGTRVISGGADTVVRVWDLATGTEVAQLTEHADWVRSVVVTPDAKCVVSCGDDKAVLVWDFATSTEVTQFTGHTDWVRSVAVTPDATRLISGGDDKTVRVWDVANGTEVAQLTGHNLVQSVTVTLDGTRMISGGTDRTVRVWDVATGSEVAQLTGHTASVLSVAVTPDATRLISGGYDTVMRVWDLATGTEVARLTGHTGWVSSVTVTPDGTRLISGGGDKTVRVWDLATGTEVSRLIGHTASVWSVAVTPDGMSAISGSTDKTIRVWDLATGAELAQLTGHTASVLSVAMTPDGTHVISSSDDNTVRVWDLASRAEVIQLTGHTSWALCVVVSPDGTRLISGGNDNAVHLWTIALRKAGASPTSVAIVLDAPVGAVAVASTDPPLILAGDALGTIHFLELIGPEDSEPRL